MMIIEIAQKLSEFDMLLVEIENMFNNPRRNINDLFELMVKAETRMMDFSLLFKRLDIVKNRYDKLSNIYIKEMLPNINGVVKGD